MKRYTCMMAAAILFWGMCFAADLYANTVNLNPSADTWISRLAPDTNYGGDTGLTSSNDGNGLADAYALLKFDVSSIPSGQTIQSAVLHLNLFGGAGPTALYYWADNSWAESTVTWNNVPSGAYEERLLQSYESTWSFTWDSSWGNIISLILAEQSVDVQSHDWHSREYSDTALRPYLEITTTAVPIPAAVWMLGSGLIGLIGIRRYKK